MSAGIGAPEGSSTSESSIVNLEYAHEVDVEHAAIWGHVRVEDVDDWQLKCGVWLNASMNLPWDKETVEVVVDKKASWSFLSRIRASFPYNGCLSKAAREVALESLMLFRRWSRRQGQPPPPRSDIDLV